MDRELFDRLLTAANGGRVASSDFLAPSLSSQLAAELRRRGVGVTAGGGFPAALRRVVTAHPLHIPEAQPKFAAVYLPGRIQSDAERVLADAGVPPAAVGDVVAHRDGVSLVTLDPPEPKLLGPPLGGEVVPLAHVAAGSVREVQVIVPALRIDALGAKAFRVSRSYFAKGIAAGNVYLNGARVAKGGSAAADDEIYADGLGWMRLRSVEGETRRGNLRVTVEVERRA